MRTKLIKSIILMTVMLMSSSFSSFFVGAEIAILNNETILIEPIVFEECNLIQSSIFHIKRLNYSSGMDSMEINYTQKLLLNNSALVEKNISKEINSYVKSNTGFVIFNRSGNFTLEFILENITLNWDYNIFNCTSNITNINDTEDDENNTINNTEETIIDVMNLFNINTNKLIYSNGDTISIYFNNISLNPFEITYWVEDLFGNVVKNKYTSTNDNPKQYTPKITEKEKTLIVKSILEYQNYSVEKDRLVVIKNNNFIEEIVEDVVEENSISINGWEYDYKENVILVKGSIAKKEGSKRIVYLSAQNTDEDLISEKVKFDILVGNKFDFTVYLKILEPVKEFDIILEGLDKFVKESVILEDINYDSSKEESKLIISNASTSKKYLDENMIWEIDVKGTGTGILILNSGLDLIFQEINQSKDKSYRFTLKMNEVMLIENYLVQNNQVFNFTTNVSFIDKNKNKASSENISLINLDFKSLNNSNANNLITGNLIDAKNTSKFENYLNLKNLTVFGTLIVILSIFYFIFKYEK